jgi:acetyl-CoA acyltransferase
MNVARVAALRAGLPTSTPGATVNRFCASGLEAVAIAAERIRAGDAEVILAGGVESMSRVPFLDIRTHPNPTLFRDAPNTYLEHGAVGGATRPQVRHHARAGGRLRAAEPSESRPRPR